MFQGLIAAALSSSENLMSRYALSKQHYESTKYAMLCFLVDAILMAPFYPFFANYDSSAITPKIIGIFVAMMIVSIIYNILIF